jgi:hypothetical protein
MKLAYTVIEAIGVSWCIGGVSFALYFGVGVQPTYLIGTGVVVAILGYFITVYGYTRGNQATSAPPYSGGRQIASPQQSSQTTPMLPHSYYARPISQGMSSFYCPKCGSPMEGGSSCKYCGTKID